MGSKLDRKALTALLDNAAEQLPPHVATRLSAARHAALQQQRQRSRFQVRLHQLVPALSAPMQRHPSGWNLALLGLFTLLVVAFFQWGTPAPHDHTELDLAILTDELPVSMYVD
ncbi:DUF3619 family protein [Ferrigenium sp. UT5]|uniref:DUF3619 family protein n=1 Tax=Ferrigenium sp. UT5 TaxID=3242105 RepID=UPI00354AD7EC